MTFEENLDKHNKSLHWNCNLLKLMAETKIIVEETDDPEILFEFLV